MRAIDQTKDKRIWRKQIIQGGEENENKQNKNTIISLELREGIIIMEQEQDCQKGLFGEGRGL